MMATKQMEKWNGKFGKEYTKRNIDAKNNYTISRLELNKLFLNDLDKDMLILEVGCNIGNQLISLQKMGFKFLYGIELQHEAVELSKHKSKNINIVYGSAFDIPFRDGFFDLVFTSGLLIHISPDDIKSVLSEIYRCSKKFIWGLEYYANDYTEIVYHGERNLLWKADFVDLYLNAFNDLRLVCEKKLEYQDGTNLDSMFLLEKIKSSDETDTIGIMRCRGWRLCSHYPVFCRYCSRRRYSDFSERSNLE
jgi:pseudaminic acid biosynthesis-associated methylase